MSWAYKRSISHLERLTLLVYWVIFLSHFSPEVYEVTKLIRPNAGVKSFRAHTVLTNAFADAASVL